MFLWVLFIHWRAGREAGLGGGERGWVGGDAGVLLPGGVVDEEVLARIRVAHLADAAPRDTLHSLLSSEATLARHAP